MDTVTEKKEALIQAYRKTFGNISQSCKAVNVSRQSFYNWLDSDPDFKQQIEEAEPLEEFLDFCELMLAKKIQEGDTTALLFALKTKGKKRGYAQNEEHGNNKPVVLQIEGQQLSLKDARSKNDNDN